MRLILFTIAVFFVLGSSAQTDEVKVFQKREFINGNFYQQTNDTIKAINEQVDIYFFKRHFFSPYYVPENFVDQRYQNQKISMWRNPKGERDYRQNWENTYTYDSLGRVTNYTYSGCFVCSNFPYSYKVKYNSAGQVEGIFNSDSIKDGYKFYYDNKGAIVKFEKYLSDKLDTEIVRIN